MNTDIEITEEVSISTPKLPRSKPKPVKMSRRVKKAKKVNRRKLLVKQLDEIVKAIVLDRDLHCVCEAPKNGHSDVRQPGHLISRTKESVRWDLRNVQEQCNSCNFLHEHFPHRFFFSFIGKFSPEAYLELCRDADTVCKLQVYELEELLGQLKLIREKQLKSILAGEPYKPYYSQREVLSGAWSK